MNDYNVLDSGSLTNDELLEQLVKLVEDNKNVEIVRQIALYFLVVNGIIDMNNSDDNTIKLLTYLNQSFVKLKSLELDISPELIDDFIEKCNNKYCEVNNLGDVDEEIWLESQLDQFVSHVIQKVKQGKIKKEIDFTKLINLLEEDI